VVDADTEFHMDPAHLTDHFDLLGTDETVACANDLAPHYYQMLENANFYQLNSSSIYGRPGKFQGLNVGVLLLDLEKQRTNSKWRNLLTEESIAKISNDFIGTALKTTLGAQDWLNLVFFHDPSMIHVLPCRFNLQLSEEYNMGPWKGIFDAYHKCDAKTDKNNNFILHGNGDFWF